MTLQASTNSIITDIEYGLDFLLSHFNQDKLFPRKIQTRKSEGRQIEVLSKQEVLSQFEKSNYIDCKINAFPSYTEYHGIQRYPSDLIFIDIDRSNFGNDKQFENALSKTLKNIKVNLNGSIPTVNNSGNGIHIIQPIECPVILEQIEQFQKYKDKGFFLSQEFLRFAEENLSNGKADPGHHPSFKSCQIRVPNSINGKCLDNRDKRLSNKVKVKTIQKWNGIRTPLTREFLEDFRTYLEQKITDQEINNYNCKKNNNNHYSNNNRIEWIDKKILANPFSDHRKIIINLILAPYLVVIKKLSFEKSYQIIYEWLQKCDLLTRRKLDFNKKLLVTTGLTTAYKKQIPPMTFQTLKNKYKNLYLYLYKKKKKKESATKNIDCQIKHTN